VENKKFFHFFNSSESHIAFTHNGIVLTEDYFIVFAASILYRWWSFLRANVCGSCLHFYLKFQNLKKKKGQQIKHLYKETKKGVYTDRR